MINSVNTPKSSLHLNPTNLKSKSDLHLARKIWHASGVSLMVILYYFFGPKGSFYLLGTLSLLVLPFDLFRQKSPKLNAFAIKFMGWAMRKNEYNSLSGSSYLCLGGLTLLVFPRDIVMMSLLFLAFADPISSYFGIRYGRDKIVGQKTLQGTMAGFITCLGISCIYFYYNNIMIERIFIVAPLAGLSGAISELIPISKIDDNFSFPVLCAVFLTVIFYLFGGFGV